MDEYVRFGPDQEAEALARVEPLDGRFDAGDVLCSGLIAHDRIPDSCGPLPWRSTGPTNGPRTGKTHPEDRAGATERKNAASAAIGRPIREPSSKRKHERRPTEIIRRPHGPAPVA